MVEIRTQRLLLRPADNGDVEAMHAILSNGQATAFWSSPPHDELAQTQAWIADMIAIDPALGEDFIVEYEGKLIGKAGFYRFPEIGYILHPSMWGRGMAREALQPILMRGFEKHRLSSVKADVDPRNLASLRLLHGLGFVEVGRAKRTWQIGDQWVDSIYLELDAESWRSMTWSCVSE